MKVRATFVALLLAAFVVTAAPAWGSTSICDGVAGNLVTNCGFETGHFTGWTLSSNSNTMLNVVTSFNPHSGIFAASLGQEGMDAFLSQNVGTNTTLYHLSFYLENFMGDETNNFTVFWNGADIGPDLVNAPPSSSYTLFSFTLVGNAGAGSNSLSFGSRNDDLFGTWFLDDIVVTKATSIVPEPSSLLLMGSGLLGLAGLVRRKLGA